ARAEHKTDDEQPNHEASPASSPDALSELAEPDERAAREAPQREAGDGRQPDERGEDTKALRRDGTDEHPTPRRESGPARGPLARPVGQPAGDRAADDRAGRHPEAVRLELRRDQQQHTPEETYERAGTHIAGDGVRVGER